MNEGARAVGDVLSLGVVIGTLGQLLPAMAALMSIIWLAIRIWESETVRLMTKRPPARKPLDD